MAIAEQHSLLDDLHLAPPAAAPRSGEQRATPPSDIARAHGNALPMPVPLFAYDLPWHTLSTDQGAEIARHLTESLVVTGLLDLDVGGQRPEGRVMCPYRPDRFGVQIHDLADAMIVDLRLTTEIGSSSAYTMDQVRRWDRRAGSLPANSLITGMRWPADVADGAALRRKVSQLRTLAPDAAIFATISPFHLDADMPQIIDAELDGMILRFDVDPRSPSAGKVIASLTATARRHLDAGGRSDMAMWVKLPSRSPLDAVKLLALGATAVSIDHLVADHWPSTVEQPEEEEEPDDPEPEPSRGTFSLSLPPAPTRPAPPDPKESETPQPDEIATSIGQMLDEALTFVHGLGVGHYSLLDPSMLATLDKELAAMTGAKHICGS